jgi:hypothetical protein
VKSPTTFYISGTGAHLHVSRMSTCYIVHMAPLRNVRHEAFARELIEAQRHGRTQAEAYVIIIIMIIGITPLFEQPPL